MAIYENLRPIIIGLLAMSFFFATGYFSVKRNPKASTGWMHLCLAIIVGTGLSYGIFANQIAGLIAAMIFATATTIIVLMFIRKNSKGKDGN